MRYGTLVLIVACVGATMTSSKISFVNPVGWFCLVVGTVYLLFGEAFSRSSTPARSCSRQKGSKEAKEVND